MEYQATKKEYTATMIALCGGSTEKMKMLTMPNYFPEEMKWEDRRKILLEICGDVTDEDVITSTTELKELPKFLLMPGTNRSALHSRRIQEDSRSEEDGNQQTTSRHTRQDR